MVTVATPTREQIKALVGSDPRLVLAIEDIFRERNKDGDDIVVLQDRVTFAELAAPEADAALTEKFRTISRGFQKGGLVFVADKYDLPRASGGVITLEADTVYWILGEIDLTGDRLVGSANSCIIGGSSENARIKSTGLSAALLTTSHTTPIRHVTFEAAHIFDINGFGSTAAGSVFDWYGVNVISPNIGTVKNVGNFIAVSCSVLGGHGWVFDGKIGTVSFSSTLFQNDGLGATVILASTANITRRFRNVDSAHVVPAGGTALAVMAGAVIPAESYILNGINFSGAGTYLSGIDQTSTTAYFSGCKGITNTANFADYYMQGNATATTIAAASTPVKVAGTTTANAITQGFTTATTNRATYARAIPRYFRVTAATSLASGNGKQIAVYIAKNGAVVASTRSTATTNASGRVEMAASIGVVYMEQGDYMEVFVANLTDTNAVTVTDLHFVAEAIE